MKCERCGSTEKLTKDHIIPKWIYKRSGHLKLKGFKKNLGGKNIQVLCAECNNRKGGSIDLSNPIALQFWLAVKEAIEREIKRM